ncbi:hypothetical protein BDBG_06983 [Blastomyces gilchristii SLH14081]|uniref:Uncharacterized protein n=1 Tax=Blastomyces gilchristii (strain SLH14081) TaxID=559298 RepID=A0A179UUP2_BLAGS|nr:uncharacterized protein BDBG_06983 [Blastomyces gilchristii SLH14081]OAT11513.1 hypothetical protein BDBG_06983 [Blastomyces gilchristii SLH14081]
MKEELQIELLRVTVSEIKLFLSSSLNDHTGSYITVLAGGEGGITTAVGRAGDEPDTDEPTDRRNDTSLQGMVTITAAVKEAEEEEDVTMRAVLSQLIDAAVSAFNLAFLTVMKTVTAS